MHEIRELIRLIDESSITELKLKNEHGKIKIKKEDQKVASISSPVVASEEAKPLPETKQEKVASAVQKVAEEKAETITDIQEDKNLHQIVSPMVGTFYRASSPDADPYVKEGDHVTEKTVVCIVEAMKLMNEIDADVKGEVIKILVENGQLVEYGEPLFLIKKD
ncbi:acetyl-CoA carboxylase biotin carboxyl carrier protein [Hazenella sp. IB182357]|uniref:Biotin carboxyl carrier protein of acetyl-CoA carboxylase n=1 Tax=Polycladospora coralii TaxID=2771432 RepID=A0A926RY76_9BACL|nr:acetyl-CoA carboxylase biotin carboxyl carrier protein [Polycladospora coralii]MBD1373246.1 acetyl-CoA carboxylase biotin carboxyl carrier protein [Polycladospora coralii]MBS7530904.1 acetyl-CoA carboxylase biotin carboxyl carrier protein [Polycladospora coralii]